MKRKESLFLLGAMTGLCLMSSLSAGAATLSDEKITADDIVILYTNDVHGGISSDADYSGSALSLGYAGLAAVKEDAKEQAGAVVTVDLGDAIQGSVVTTETDGKDAMDLMDAVGYDIRIPGNHEFDYGMEAFLDYAESAPSDFISCNFIDTASGDSILPGYTVKAYEVGGEEVHIGFVGISTPETIAKSTPTYFQDEDGNYIYGFNANTPQDLYDCVQDAVDAAYADGADMVIALSHLGDSGVEEDWSSVSVCANTTGISAFLDGHAHNVIPEQIIQNKDGEDVILSSTGTKLENIGVMKIDVEGKKLTISTDLVNKVTDEEKDSDAYKEVDEMVQGMEEELAYLFVNVGHSDFALVIYDPADASVDEETGEKVSGTRLIRKQETNMGDFLTDAYRQEMKTDVAVLNGGSIRADLTPNEDGELKYMGIISVFPWNTEVTVVRIKGQTILDALEMGAHLYPEECGGFLQVSGMTYAIDTTIDSSVNINSDGEFVSVDGEYRVKDVMVGDEPLDLDKEYTMAINAYYSQEYGDGMTMFKDAQIIFPAEGDDPVVDHDVIIDFLKDNGDQVPAQYEDPYGEGRITLLDEAAKAAAREQAEAVTEGAGQTQEETEAVTEGAQFVTVTEEPVTEDTQETAKKAA